MTARRHLKNIFIPHRHNGYKPHAIRHYGLATVLVLVIMMQGVFNWQQAGTFKVLGYATNVSISELLSLTNQNRGSNGLSGLSLNSQLNSAAQSKAQHMIANDYWAHVAPDGTSPWYFIGASGYAYDKAGENLAYGFATSSGTVQGWMDSPGHRANILDGAFADVGFGIANGSNFQGGENTVVVAMYGQPTAVAAAPVSAPAPPPAAVPSTTTPSPEPVEVAEEVTSETESEESEEIVEEQSSIDLNELLAKADTDTIFVTQGSIEQLSGVKGQTVTNFGAILSGQAHWSLYVSLGALMAIALIYLSRHATAAYQLVLHGEHYIQGHPLLEASIVYAAVWLLLAGSYGAVL